MAMQPLASLVGVLVSFLGSGALDIPSAVEQCKAQCRYDSLYVEYGVVFTMAANETSEETRMERTCRFAGRGADFYISFEEFFDPPKVQTPRNFHCTKDLYEYLYCGGLWKWRLRNFISELPEPSEGGFEDAAAERNLHGFWPTARTLLGLFGAETREQRNAVGLTLLEFLGKEGPFRMSEEGGFQILSHEATYNNGEGEKKVSADIWLDGAGHISRIDEVRRVWDLDEATIGKYYSGTWFGLRMVVESVEGYDYFDDPSGFRYPKSAVVICFAITPEIREFLQKRAQLPPDEFAVRLCTFPVAVNSRAVVEATKIEVNRALPEGLLDMKFSAGSVVYSDMDLKEHRFVDKPSEPRWYVRRVGWLMAGACVFIVVVAGFVTQRWLGWRG